MTERIKAGPRQICHRWHEYATTDMLFAQWLEALPNRRITLEYRELFAPGFADRITGFLGVEPDPGMKSPLVKQNPNDVLARFENPAPIRAISASSASVTGSNRSCEPMRVLYVNWVDYLDAERRGGGVSVYQRNLMAEMGARAGTEAVFPGLGHLV